MTTARVITAFGVFLAASVSAACAEKPVLAEFDEFAPEIWDKALGAVREKQSEFVRKLIEIAKDPDRKDKDRDRAVLLLGKIMDPQCIEFFVANIAMELPPISGAIFDDARERPCYYVLGLAENRGNWNTAKAILESLSKQKSDKEMVYLVTIYQQILESNHALALVDLELGKRPDPERKKRLEYFKKNIQ